MINLLVSEAEAFDFLSILLTKSIKDPISKNKDNFSRCSDYICIQLGAGKVCNIIQSKEYKKLCKINEDIFDLIDLLRKHNESVGDKIDLKNLQRFEAKKKLQKKFFGNKINETKLTYNK